MVIEAVCEICAERFTYADSRRAGRFCSIPCRSKWTVEANRARAYVMDEAAKQKRKATFAATGKRGPEHHAWTGGPEASRLRVIAKGSRASALREYRARVPGKVAQWDADRRARKMCATPPWLRQTDTADVYFSAEILNKITGKKHHVDHIMPLAGKNVCGLHVPSNLRAIPATLNSRKSRRVPENPEHLEERAHQYFVAAVFRALRLGTLKYDAKAAKELA